MSLLPIRLWPDPVLARRAEPITAFDEDLRRLASDMFETMYAAPGRGLAAPQVGILKRLFVMDVTWKEGARSPMVCINPRILWRSEAVVTGPEGCLSIPGVVTEVPRAAEIRLGWMGLDEVGYEAHLTGFAAICAQHEYDHLDGVVTFDRLDPEARAVAEAAYAEGVRA